MDIMNESMLVRLLCELCSAPETQISESYRKKAKLVLRAPKENVREFETKILEFFEEIQRAPLTEVSSFVQRLVDPKYTSSYRTVI